MKRRDVERNKYDISLPSFCASGYLASSCTPNQPTGNPKPETDAEYSVVQSQRLVMGRGAPPSIY